MRVYIDKVWIQDCYNLAHVVTLLTYLKGQHITGLKEIAVLDTVERPVVYGLKFFNGMFHDIGIAVLPLNYTDEDVFNMASQVGVHTESAANGDHNLVAFVNAHLYMYLTFIYNELFPGQRIHTV